MVLQAVMLSHAARGGPYVSVTYVEALSTVGELQAKGTQHPMSRVGFLPTVQVAADTLHKQDYLCLVTVEAQIKERLQWKRKTWPLHVFESPRELASPLVVVPALLLMPLLLLLLYEDSTTFVQLLQGCCRRQDS